jgi:hypothetical protein
MGRDWKPVIRDLSGRPAFYAQNQWLQVSLLCRPISVANDALDQNLQDFYPKWMIINVNMLEITGS